VLSFSDKSEKILDLGCGSSKILEAFPQAIGMDVAFNKLRYRRRLINPLVNGDILAVPFKNHSFDELICSSVIEHVKDDKHIFKEFNRILKPGGILILGTPDYAKVLWNIIEKLYKHFHPSGYADEHITHYTFKGLHEKLQKYGFELVIYRYICGSEFIVKARKRLECSI
jgi:ubiquinone/menaquinone biosynthesis C-methylase UbiE